MGAVTHIDAPGLYMDAVNPDYLVVRLLGQSAATPAWVLPGVLMFGLFPVLGQIYHGALPYWLGLPAYALFGTGVVGVRLTNMLFGLLVLVSAGLFLRAFRARPVVAGLTLAALALDPGFLFTFRTQFYINVLPLALLLLAVAWAEHRRLAPTPAVAFATGVLAGASVYGYFIYAFLVPVAALHAALRWHGDVRAGRLMACWSAGLAVGAMPYLLGMILIMAATGGPQGFLDFIKINLGALSVGQSVLTLAGRLDYFRKMVLWTVTDVGPTAMMLHRSLPLAFPALKPALLLGLPAFGAVCALARPSARPGILVVLGFVLGTGILFVAFGNRLWLHHAAMLLPILYLALALTLDLAGRSRMALAAALLVTVPLIAGNAADRQAVMVELDRTGGVGLASDAVERFAEDALRHPAPTHAFFPDWGIFMPFTMVTSGSIPLTAGFTPEEARAALCAGQDALLAVVNADGLDRLRGWTEAVGWSEPEQTTYLQRDGIPVLTSLRWRADNGPVRSCTAS